LKLSEIQSTLRDLDAPPTKSLGQNFLHDRNLAEWTVAQLGIEPKDRWLEVGPGLGSLTDFAMHRSGNGVLIEKDDRLISFLRNRFPSLEVVHGDASRFDVRDLHKHGPVKVFGNLPYYVSSQILFNFTTDTAPVAKLVFTLQRELAERLAASDSTKAYGAPTVLIGRTWRVQLLRTLPPSVFSPVPKVDSAVVSLTRRSAEEMPVCDGSRFNEIVKLGFSQRRKQLGNLIARALAEWRTAFDALSIPQNVRAENLSITQWCQLAAWSEHGTSHCSQQGAQDVHGEMFDIVDKKDRIIGQGSRHEVHTKKLLHRAVHVFVFNKKHELFLQRRSRWKDVCPLLWDSSAAGHVDSGHDYDETAKREVREELGVDVTPVLAGRIEACENTGHEFVNLYQAQHDGPFVLPPAEIDSGEWFSQEQIREWIASRPEDFAPGFLSCWSVWIDSQLAFKRMSR
jgi:16S rRNA (adenine1518-N6/adenine1519-N6)-dimethyltransferase